MSAIVGTSVARTDGAAKVTGRVSTEMWSSSCL